jgi:iron complex outermembrane receptor protein
MRRHFLCGVALFTLMGAASGAEAQETAAGSGQTGAGSSKVAAGSGQASADSSKPSDNTGVADIIITAQRREESLQKASVSVTAITGTALTERQITKPEELVSMAPAVKITEAVGPTAKGFNIRGVGTQVFSGIPISAPVVIDEFVVPPYIGFQSLFDVDTVQILKGPQGTAFGADSSSGLVNIVTAKPRLGVFSGKFHASYQTADSQTHFETSVLQGVLNIPVGSKAAIRVTGYYTHRTPWLNDPVLGRKIEPATDEGIRAKFLWKPTDSFSAEITGSYSRQNQPFHTTPIVSVVPGGFYDSLFTKYGAKPGVDNQTVFVNNEGIGRFSDYYMLGKLTWNFGGGYSLQSTTGYLHKEIEGLVDADLGPLNLLNSVVGKAAPGGPKNRGWNFSEELKLTSPAGGRLTWVAGALYYRSFNFAPGAFIGKLAPALVNTPLFFDFRYSAKTKVQNYALYGQGTYKITDGWRLLAGARVTKQDSTFEYNSFNMPGALPFSFAAVPLFQQSFHNWGYAWKLGVEHDLGRNAMAYANVARGYKGAGWSQISVKPGQDTYVKPEIPMNYELGVKSMLFDRKLRLNAAVFITNYKDYQAQVYDPTPPVARILTANAGSLKTYGAELEFDARPVDHLSLSGGVAYIHAKFHEFNNQPCYPGQTAAEGCVGGFASGSGKDLPNSPRWTYTLAANYTPPIGNGLKAILSANYYWRSSANFSALGDPRSVIKAYGLLGGSIGVAAENDSWKLQVFAKNLLDKRYVAGLGHLSTLYNSLFGKQEQLGVSTYLTPEMYRQIGVSLDISF